MLNSYGLGISVTLLSLVLSIPTAIALGRYEFPGKNIAQMLILLPMVMPGFVIAIFFTSFLYRVGDLLQVSGDSDRPVRCCLCPTPSGFYRFPSPRSEAI